MDKFDLENALYARARRVGAQIWARGGVLSVSRRDGLLCALLSVYETFFGAENRAFLKEDLAAEQVENAAFARAFEREAGRLGPCAAAPLGRRPFPPGRQVSYPVYLGKNFTN